MTGQGGNVLRRAIEVIREREKQYGPPEEHWAITSAIATALLSKKLKPGEVVTAEDWARLMLGDKLARDLGPDPGLDQPVDMAGYADGLGRLRVQRAGSGSAATKPLPTSPLAGARRPPAPSDGT